MGVLDKGKKIAHDVGEKVEEVSGNALIKGEKLLDKARAGAKSVGIDVKNVAEESGEAVKDVAGTAEEKAKKVADFSKKKIDEIKEKL